MNPYTHFESVKSKYEARIEDLSTELTLAEDELRELRQEREAILKQVLKNGDVSKIESRIEVVRKRVAQLKDRIQYAESGMLEQLAGILDDVEDQRQCAVAKKQDEYKEAICELNRKKLLYLADAARIGQLVTEINEINAHANECRCLAGKAAHLHWPFESQLTLTAHPSLTGFDDASFKTLAIPEWLVRSALYEMKLPSWKEDLNDGNK
ncbi:hypothetical protein N6H14_31095 [Paenibacillus sp. CC-CFT747]|nr:hypothetical protein N6H14_31095 [Paenibacillus sp. CC-CFT747]